MQKFLYSKWTFHTPKREESSLISKETGIHPLLVQVLLNRKITNPKTMKCFLEPTLSLLTDPFQMKDMDLAAERISQAIGKDEKICVYGDFDVDGITSVAIMVRFFRWLGKETIYYIPHRINEGYGLNIKAIKKIADEEVNLLITVDNGINSVKEVEYANSLGLDVIITDHHQALDRLPPALAVVDPNREDCNYPFQSLSGVGIAFKLIHAIAKRMGINPKDAKSFLMNQIDLVALGTIADIVPILDENRILVKYGLQKMQKTTNIGLNTMLQLLGIIDKPVTSTNVGFYIAPRLNAAGRTTHASICVELLLTEDPLKAMEIARHLNRLNEERRSLEEGILDDCVDQIESEIDVESERIIVVKGEGWHIGVLGIVASKLVEIYTRPVIVISMEKDFARGSARSIESYNIFEALSDCKNLLISFGGHKRAAGFKLKLNQIESFTKTISEHAKRKVSDDDLLSSILIDAEISTDDLNYNFVNSLSSLEPYGSGNPCPVFLLKNIKFNEPPRIVGKNHLKFSISKNGYTFNGIAFSVADYIPSLKSTDFFWDIAITPFINTWNGHELLEFEIKGISPS